MKIQAMKTVKIIAFVVSLLGTGFVGGFVTHRVVVKKGIERVAGMRMAMGFQRELFRVINADEEQKELLAPHVEKYSVQMAKIMNESRFKRKSMMDSLYKEIKPLLSPEQLEELEQFGKRFRQKERERRERRKNNRPPREKPQ